MATWERLGYITAVFILVIGGAVILTPILNWLSGPIIVIVSVWFWVWFADRKAARP